MPRLSRGGVQITLFLLRLPRLLDRPLAARSATSGRPANAHWIVDLEDTLSVRVEGDVQNALTGSAVLWILNHVYLIAQMVVLPGALYFLHRKSRPAYAKLRNTILATWLLSIPVYGLFPVAPPRLADVGMVDTISSRPASRWTRA